MIKGTVVAPIWATKRINAIAPGALLEVKVEGIESSIVALDQLGTGVGETVLVAQGSSVARYLGQTSAVDALIVGVVDET